MALNRCSTNILQLSKISAVYCSRLSSSQVPAHPIQDLPKKEFVDIETHTGQKFEKDDFRLARFVGKEKKVNPRFAIDLIAEIPPTAVKGRRVMCNGGGGPLGHPNVFINLDGPGNHSCGYCGLRFFQEHSHHH